MRVWHCGVLLSTYVCLSPNAIVSYDKPHTHKLARMPPDIGTLTFINYFSIYLLKKKLILLVVGILVLSVELKLKIFP